MPFAGGDGSQSNPYQIETWEHLDSVRNNLSSYFVLNNDLDSNTSGYDTYASSNANSGSGWIPLGLNSSTVFTGGFDGQGHIIEGLFIDRSSTQNVGLFSEIGEFENTADFCKKVGVTDADITGQGSVGVIAGTVFESSLSNVFGTGSVTGNSFTVGGLFGRIIGGVSEYLYSTVSVDNGSNSNTGGLIGRLSDGTLNQGYSTGNVTGSGSTGGLVGYNEGTSDINNSYWDTQSSALSDGVGLNEGTEDVTGLTTSEMQGQEAETNMSAFDFTNNWNTVTSEQITATADGYPVLVALNEQNQLEAQGIYNPPPDAGLYIWTGSTWKKVAGV